MNVTSYYQTVILSTFEIKRFKVNFNQIIHLLFYIISRKQNILFHFMVDFKTRSFYFTYSMLKMSGLKDLMNKAFWWFKLSIVLYIKESRYNSCFFYQAFHLWILIFS